VFVALIQMRVALADKLRMVDLSVPFAGLQRAASSVDHSAQRIARSTVPASVSAPTDIIDLSAEMVNLTQAANAFSANANVLKAMEGLDQAILNILA
jgi:flagellar hook-associated protein FlgK